MLLFTRQVTRATHVRNRVCPRVELIFKIIIILLIIFLGFIMSKYCIGGRLRATLARSALTCVSLARFSLARFILMRFQFGAFLFGALPLRRVSLWRASTSARFTLARFPILYEPTVIRYLRTRGLFVCMFLFRVSQFLLSKLMHNRLFDHLFPFCACFLRRSVVYASFAAKPLY